MVKVKYIGAYPADCMIGRVEPGEIREVKKELAEVLVRGLFKIVKTGKVVAETFEEEEDCKDCPKEKEE